MHARNNKNNDKKYHNDFNRIISKKFQSQKVYFLNKSKSISDKNFIRRL